MEEEVLEVMQGCVRRVANGVVLTADGEVVKEAPSEQFFISLRHQRSRQFVSQIG